ncbi:MAG: hypothetical protein ACOZNI_30440 [Myxococcota bacterium]
MSASPPTCLQDATSIVGLAELFREHPDEWKGTLKASIPLRIPERPTVAQALRCDLPEVLVPSSRCLSPAGVKKKRAIAAHLDRVAGDQPVLLVDEALVARVEEEIVREAGPERMRKARRRAMDVGNMLRRLAFAAQWKLEGRQPVVSLRAGSRSLRPSPRRPARKAIDPRVLRRLLGSAKEALLLMIVLTAGCGLLEREALRLRVRRVRAYVVIWVHGGGVRGRPGVTANRKAYVPAWGRPILKELLPGLEDRDPEELLFANRWDERRPRSTLLPELQRAAAAVGYTEPIGFTDLVDLYRAMCKRARIPRALARRTHVDDETGLLHPAYPRLRRLAEEWVAVDEPPGLADRRALRVARKASRFVKPKEPESLRRPWARPAPPERDAKRPHEKQAAHDKPSPHTKPSPSRKPARKTTPPTPTRKGLSPPKPRYRYGSDEAPPLERGGVKPVGGAPEKYPPTSDFSPIPLVPPWPRAGLPRKK